MTTSVAPAAAQILQHVRGALAESRTPGMHFAGFYFGLTAEELGPPHGCAGAETRFSIPYGPHAIDADGGVNLGAVAMLADMTVSVAMRFALEPNIRMATTCLTMQFSGELARGAVTTQARFEGLVKDARMRQGHCSGEITSGGVRIGQVRATFATPPAPPGKGGIEPRWASHRFPLDDLLGGGPPDPDEAAVLARAEATLAEPAGLCGFATRFWDQTAAAPDGEGRAACRVPLAPHLRNRVGHVQGGLLLAIAASCAAAALPGKTLLTNACAWYLRPGEGSFMDVRSTRLHGGATASLVRTEVHGDDGRLVFVLMTSHAGAG